MMDPPQNPFERMFREPTPEEIAEGKRRRMEAWQADERRFKAYLPHLITARDALRETASLGCNGERFRKLTSELAILIEDIELELRRSPE